MVKEAKAVEKIDDVDVYLAQQDGQIIKPRDPQRCRHNARQKCSYCLPIDPYDEEYLKEKEIKHMSFHAYCRKLISGHGKGTHLKKPLENVRLSVDLCCSAHKPYPKGVCTKCRPPTVTLNRQKYRHVDNIVLENEDVVNEFLNFWRRSNTQRMGYLIGRYEPFADVPLGIRAVVVAIYEPPQTASQEGIKLEDEGKQGDAVDNICEKLGLKRVGWIFTDLWSSDQSQGTVHCTRGPLSYLLSAEECITAAALQLKHPNATQYCSDGTFGSKFVTVVASGNESEHVSFHGYQVTEQCEQLVEANILCPTNHYELAYIRETPLNEQHYITEVQYTEKNEYGAEVRRNGRPLPVEFLMVDVPTGVPKEPAATFHISKGKKFPIENRDAIGEIRDHNSLTVYCEQFTLEQFVHLASNFHFLLFLASQDVIPFTDKELSSLCAAVRLQDAVAATNWATTTDHWTTLVALSHHDNASSGVRAEATWACGHCTFENEKGRGECQMCGLPPTTA